MLTRKLAIAALTIAIASPAFAQQMNPTTQGSAQSSIPSSSSPSFVQDQTATDWRSSKLVGASVYGMDNASIGEIDDILIGNDGNIKAAVIGVGGFLGVGQKDVAVTFDKLTISRKAGSSAIDKVTVSLTKDELRNAPKFTYFETPAATTGSSMTDKRKSMSPTGSSSKDK